jgi:hypothetical protein
VLKLHDLNKITTTVDLITINLYYYYSECNYRSKAKLVKLKQLNQVIIKWPLWVAAHKITLQHCTVYIGNYSHILHNVDCVNRDWMHAEH